MARLTPAEFREKHARRLKAATEDMRKGIEAVTESPTAKAANKMDKLRTNLLKAIDSGKMAKRLKAVSLEDWKRKTVDVGIGRVAAGIDASAAKVEDFASQLLPHLDKLHAEIERMPDVTLDDSINRMIAHTRGMAKFEKK